MKGLLVVAGLFLFPLLLQEGPDNKCDNSPTNPHPCECSHGSCSRKNGDPEDSKCKSFCKKEACKCKNSCQTC